MECGKRDQRIRGPGNRKCAHERQHGGFAGSYHGLSLHCDRKRRNRYRRSHGERCRRRAYPDSNAFAHPFAVADDHTHSNSDTDAKPNANTNPHTDTNAHTNSKPNANAKSKPHADASTHRRECANMAHGQRS